MRRRTHLVPGAVAFLLFLSIGCGEILYADGPYLGRVIDKETKQPIEGAAVLAVWYKRTASLGHPSVTFYDAQETLTDNEGNFTIPGTSTVSLNPLSRVDEPRFTIFKPGYKAYSGLLVVLVQNLVPTGLYEKDGRMVAELRQLTTRKERLDNQGRVSVSDCDRNEKCPNLIRLINVERSNLGLKPIGPIKKRVNQ